MARKPLQAAPPRRRCVICADPAKKDWVARRLLEGHSLSKIETMSRETPMFEGAIKRETIVAHRDRCLAIKGTQDQLAEATRTVAAKVDTGALPTDDVATMVQREVIRKLEAGEARVTVQHGLQAQALLDRRAERAKDRALQITLARMLHTPSAPVAAIRERVTVEPVVIDDAEYEVIAG